MTFGLRGLKLRDGDISQQRTDDLKNAMSDIQGLCCMHVEGGKDKVKPNYIIFPFGPEIDLRLWT